MNGPNESNPYAAPQSELLPASLEAERMRRPASVKWVTALMTFIAITVPILYARIFPEHGWRMLTDYPMGTALDVFKVLACLPLLFGGRKPWVYWITFVTLVLILNSAAGRFLGGVPELFEHLKFDPIGESVACLTFFGIGYLFYRFALGKPSRQYFGIPLRWSVR